MYTYIYVLDDGIDGVEHSSVVNNTDKNLHRSN